MLTTQEAQQLGNADAGQLQYAMEHQRAMLTQNRVDFEQLHANTLEAQQSHAGILVANRRASDFELARRILTLLNRFAVDKVPCSSSSCAQDRRAMDATQNFAQLGNLPIPFSVSGAGELQR